MACERVEVSQKENFYQSMTSKGWRSCSDWLEESLKRGGERVQNYSEHWEKSKAV